MSTIPTQYKDRIHPEWWPLLQPILESDIMRPIYRELGIRRAQGATIFPPQAVVFNAFLKTPPSQLKVVILGQDPYHTPGMAMGLSFSVPSTTPKTKIPPSLRNIFKELNSDLHGLEEEEILSISEEEKNRFALSLLHPGFAPPSDGSLFDRAEKILDDLERVENPNPDLTRWAEQGVLLLNGALTVEQGNPGCHAKLWEPFTTQIMQMLNGQFDNLVFILMGSWAQSWESLIKNPTHSVIKTAHPSPFSAHKGFFGSKIFSKTNKILEKTNGKIKW